MTKATKFIPPILPYFSEDKDFEVVDKEVWRIFFEKYNGYAVKRLWRGDRCTNTELDLYFRAIPLIIIPPLDEIEYDLPELEFKRLHISKFNTLKMFKDLIAEIVEYLYNIDYKEQYSKIRVWKYDSK